MFWNRKRERREPPPPTFLPATVPRSSDDSISEEIFLRLLREGKSFLEAMRRSGADWQRIDQKLRTDEAFALRCFQAQDQRVIARALRLASLTDSAIDTVERAIAN